MFCRKCGKEIPDDSEFCQSCGSKVENKVQNVVSDTVNISEKIVIQNSTQEIEVDKPILGYLGKRTLSFLIDMIGLYVIYYIFDITLGKIIKDPLSSIIGIIFFLLYLSFSKDRKWITTKGFLYSFMVSESLLTIHC